MTTQLSTQVEKFQELQKQNQSLNSELQRAKEALKNMASGPRQVDDQLDQLQGTLALTQQENEQLSAEVLALDRERGQLRADIRQLHEARQLHKQKEEELQRELTERKNAIAIEEQPLATAATQVEKIEELRAEVIAMKEDQERERVQHKEEVEQLKTEHNQEILQLRESLAELDTLKGIVTQLEEEKVARESKIKELFNKLEQRSSLEEELKSTKEALAAEQAAKKVHKYRT